MNFLLKAEVQKLQALANEQVDRSSLLLNIYLTISLSLYLLALVLQALISSMHIVNIMVVFGCMVLLLKAFSV